MSTTWKEERTIARLEILHTAEAIAENPEYKDNTVMMLFAGAVREYMKGELQAEAQSEVRTLPPFDPELDHDGETQPGVANPEIESGYVKQCTATLDLRRLDGKGPLTCMRFQGHEGVHRHFGYEWADARLSK
jgi:hypothetical protein